jgi:hypothetical protein
MPKTSDHGSRRASCLERPTIIVRRLTPSLITSIVSDAAASIFPRVNDLHHGAEQCIKLPGVW